VTVRFLDPDSKNEIRSTELAKRVLSFASVGLGETHQNIVGCPDWRKWYLSLYSALAIEEGKSLETNEKIASRALQEFQAHIFDEAGLSIREKLTTSFDQDPDIQVVSIRGTGKPQRVSIPSAKTNLEDLARNWVQDSLAEPGLIEAYKFLDDSPNLDISDSILFAIAGAAEFAPTENWLEWGGKVAVVARPNPENWIRLINTARRSGGELLVPVRKDASPRELSELSDIELSEIAGLDIKQDSDQIASWLGELSIANYKNIILGLYAYSPSVDHIRVQAIQELIADIASTKIDKSKLVLSWLATPTDSAPGPEALGLALLDGYRNRKPLRILADSLLGLLNFARPPRPNFFATTSGQALSLIDASVQQQGPSYSFSKRMQRYRAFLAHNSGIRVSYAVAPPARTDSVLRHRILRASYRGAPSFGVKPFEVDVAKAAMAALLVRDVYDKKSNANQKSTVSIHSDAAIHGGLWRIPYNPKSIWIIATLIGLPALFRKGY
jgi:hypothetical protein